MTGDLALHRHLFRPGRAGDRRCCAQRKDPPCRSSPRPDRAHHQVIGKIVHALWEEGFDPTRFNRLPEPMRREVRLMMAEILGLGDGWTGGRGGSMHLRNAPLGIMGTNPIVGAGMPVACGIAYALKVRNEGGLMVTFLGEGALHQGAAHEAMHLAALYDLPMIFFLENNQYAISMTVAESTRATELLSRPAAHGIPAVKVDGMNPLAKVLEQAALAGRADVEEGIRDLLRDSGQDAPLAGALPA